MASDRLVKFKAEYARMLAPFISEDETRYFLHGIAIYPHPDKGVLLVATNGHVMGVIHDEFGETNGDWVFPLTPAMCRAMEPDMRTAFDEDEGEYEYDARDVTKRPHWLHFIGDVAYLVAAECDDVQSIGNCHACVDYAPAIDGKFPSWRQAVPEKVAGTRPIPFSARYLSYFANIATVRGLGKSHAYMTLFTGEETGPAVVRFGEIPEFLGVIMPVKDSAPTALPDWLPEPTPPA